MIDEIQKYFLKIKEPIPLGAAGLFVIIFIIYHIINENLTPLFGGIVIILAVLLVCIVCFTDVKRITQSSSSDKALPEEYVDSPIVSTDLRVNDDIWRKIDPVLGNIGFTIRVKSDSENLLTDNFEFSLAKGPKSLLIVQLQPEKLNIDVTNYISGLKNDLEKVRTCVIEKIVVICYTNLIDDGVFHHMRRNDMVLLSKYSIQQLEKSKPEIYLKRELGL